MPKKIRDNLAFVDGQNLYMGTAKREIDPCFDYLENVKDTIRLKKEKGSLGS